MVAAAGTDPCPQITSGLPRRTSERITGTSPPGPLRCGSTTCKVNAVAHAASKALPPRSRIPMPTAVAIQWVEVTTPNVPSISGRVVNRFGLTKFMGVRGSRYRKTPDLTTVRRPGKPPLGRTSPRLSHAIDRAGVLRRLRLAARAGHPLKDLRPVFGILDDIAHPQQKCFLGEIAAPALAAIKLDIMP